MNAARAPGVASQRGLQRLRRDAVRHAELRLVLAARPTSAGRRESTRPSITDACALRCTTTGAPSGASARQSAWLPCVAPLVRNHERAAP